MTLRSASSCLIALLLIATAADAQSWRGPRGRGPFGGRGAPGGLLFLVSVDAVQDELAVTAEQRELLESLQADLSDQRRGLFARRFAGPPEPGDRNERSDEIQQGMEKLNRQGDELVTAILEPNQTERLQQLRLQHEGVRAFERPEIVKDLGLSDSQLAKIRQMRDEVQPRGAENEVEDAPAIDRRADRGQLESRILAVLTNQQIEDWEKMKGKEFEFPERVSRLGQRRSRGRSEGDRGERQRRPPPAG
jgi:hypothetical protein